MNLIANILTAAAIAVHGTLGCCAHGAHGGEEVGRQGCEDHCCSGHAGHHHERHATKPAPTAPHHKGAEVTFANDGHSHVCHHARCTWYAPEVWGAGWVDSVITALTLPPANAAYGSPAAVSPALIDVLHSGVSMALPVRSHLLKSVLLI